MKQSNCAGESREAQLRSQLVMLVTTPESPCGRAFLVADLREIRDAAF